MTARTTRTPVPPTIRRAAPGADLGPGERHAKPDGVTLELAGRGGGVRARAAGPDALDRYAVRGQLAPGDAAENRRRYDAALRLRLDWTQAGLEASVTSGYEERIDGGSRRDRMAVREDAYRRFRGAMRAVGPIAAHELVEVACLGRAVGRTGLEILRRGLAVLADHYETGPSAPPSRPAGPAVR